jgi:hypothetical protein
VRIHTLIILLAVLAVTGAAQPKLTIAGGNSFNLGTVYRGAVAVHRVELRNTGNATLTLGRVEVSCGCTGSIVSNGSIAAGDTGSILITFNSKNFVGPVHKSVTIHSNAEPETSQLEFTATVVDEILMTPPQFFFQDAEVHRKSVVTMTVTNNGSAPLSFRSFRTQLKGLTLVFPSAPIAPGANGTITAEFTPESAGGVLTDGVMVTTTNEHQPEVYIQVFGAVQESKFK